MTQSELVKHVGDSLRAERHRKGLTLADIKKATGLNETTMVGYEKGLRSIRLTDACTLAAFYGITLDQLAGRNLETTTN